MHIQKKDINLIDKNFIQQTVAGMALKFIDTKTEVFEHCGFPWFKKEQEYCRFPQHIIPEVNDGLKVLGWHTAGGAIRFKTNSTTIALDVELDELNHKSNMPLSGSSGFDLFAGCGKKSYFTGNNVL